jgi:hypothetical protein
LLNADSLVSSSWAKSMELALRNQALRDARELDKLGMTVACAQNDGVKNGAGTDESEG